MRRKQTKAQVRAELFSTLALAIARAYRRDDMYREDIDRILAAVIADWQALPVNITLGHKP